LKTGQIAEACRGVGAVVAAGARLRAVGIAVGDGAAVAEAAVVGIVVGDGAVEARVGATDASEVGVVTGAAVGATGGDAVAGATGVATDVAIGVVVGADDVAEHAVRRAARATVQRSRNSTTIPPRPAIITSQNDRTQSLRQWIKEDRWPRQTTR